MTIMSVPPFFPQFSVSFAHCSSLLCSPYPPFQRILRQGSKKNACFAEKSWKNILPVRGIVVPLHSLSENFPGASIKEAIFDILQTTTRQRPVLKEIRDVKQDTSIQKNNEFSKERKCLGRDRQFNILFKCQSYHTLLYNI